MLTCSLLTSNSNMSRYVLRGTSEQGSEQAHDWSLGSGGLRSVIEWWNEVYEARNRKRSCAQERKLTYRAAAILSRLVILYCELRADVGCLSKITTLWRMTPLRIAEIAVEQHTWCSGASGGLRCRGLLREWSLCKATNTALSMNKTNTWRR